MTDAGRRSAEIVIAGAGIAGIATAWHLAERGAGFRTVIVDPRPPLSLTSNRPEANHRTWWPHPSMVELAARSLDLIGQLRADGAAIPMDHRGYLFVSDEPSTAPTLPSVVDGHPATAASQAVALDGDELRRRWPHLGPSVLGGIFVGRAGGLDTVALGQAMLDRAVAGGVRLIRGEVAGVEVTGGRVAGIAVGTEEGPLDLSADVLIDAAGPYAGDVARLASIDLPLETVLRQKVVIRDATRVIPRDAPFTITLDGRSLAWSDEERDRLASDPDTRRLLDRLPGGIHVKPDDSSEPDAIKLGWAWDPTPRPPVEDPACPPDFPRMVLLGACAIVPGLASYAEALADGRLAPVAHDGGFYARTPDGRPLIGPAGGPDGLHVVGGLAGFGAMMAAAAGELAADWIAPRSGTSAPSESGALDPRRFADPAYAEVLRTGAVATGEL